MFKQRRAKRSKVSPMQKALWSARKREYQRDAWGMDGAEYVGPRAPLSRVAVDAVARFTLAALKSLARASTSATADSCISQRKTADASEGCSRKTPARAKKHSTLPATARPSWCSRPSYRALAFTRWRTSTGISAKEGEEIARQWVLAFGGKTRAVGGRRRSPMLRRQGPGSGCAPRWRMTATNGSSRFPAPRMCTCRRFQGDQGLMRCRR